MAKEYYLQVNGDGSLNRGSLSLLEGEKDITLIDSIKQPTDKGWESKKKIYEDVEVIYKESDYECKTVAWSFFTPYLAQSLPMWVSSVVFSTVHLI